MHDQAVKGWLGPAFLHLPVEFECYNWYSYIADAIGHIAPEIVVMWYISTSVLLVILTLLHALTTTLHLFIQFHGATCLI